MRILNRNDLGYSDETMAVHDPINDYDPMYKMTIAEDFRCYWCSYLIQFAGLGCLAWALLLIIQWSLRP
jgi:hypothetical protein